MNIWLTLLLSLWQSPFVQEKLKQLFALIWERLTKRFGPLPASNRIEFAAALNQRLSSMPDELWFWQIGKKRALRRMGEVAMKRVDELWDANKRGVQELAPSAEYIRE